jgi:hypothetical protein
VNCPYCAETIASAAVVCKHCGRDLSFFLPLSRRLDLLEQRVAALSQAIELIGKSAAVGPRASGARGFSQYSTLVNVTTVAAVSVAFCGIYWLAWTSQVAWLLLAAMWIPALGGFVFGLAVQFPPVTRCVALGFCIGFVDAVGSLLIYNNGLFPLPDDWATVARWVLIGQPIQFMLAAIGAGWVKRRYLGVDALQQPNRLAELLGGLGRPSQDELLTRVQFWKALIDGATPVISLLGTIVTAFFTYLASKPQ